MKQLMIAALTAAFVSLPATASAQQGIAILSTGTVVAKNSAVIVAKVVAYVKKINADAGDTVKKGQPLVVLDGAEFAADAALSQGRLDEAVAVEANAGKQYRRMESLMAKGSTTQSALDDAATAHERAKAGVAIAKAALARANAYLGYATLRAPFDGIVEFRKVELGELTAPGQPLMKVTDTVHLRFETSVKESDVNRIAVGDTVNVFVDALGETPVSGTVAHLVPSGDPASHSFTVRIDLAPTKGMKPGMYGKVRWQ
ncbi:MAG: efflux RND transporter periplasmic adaptor subunit [Nitrospinae bacterium]|nr:efflux RND transporter periplasmic adaptor subunit [Nitrospinota bacterium]